MSVALETLKLFPKVKVFKAEHPLNILRVSVQAEVLKLDTFKLVKDLQLWNILDISVHLAVFQLLKFKEVIDAQSRNKELILVTLLTSQF